MRLASFLSYGLNDARLIFSQKTWNTATPNTQPHLHVNPPGCRTRPPEELATFPQRSLQACGNLRLGAAASYGLGVRLCLVFYTRHPRIFSSRVFFSDSQCCAHLFALVRFEDLFMMTAPVPVLTDSSPSNASSTSYSTVVALP